MKREMMLQILASVPFTLIDPMSEWKDVGFTERPIWVNSKGYGYIMCDEPCSSVDVEGVPVEKWQSIHSKLAAHTLRTDDIKETSLMELLEEITHGYFDEDEDDICEILEGLEQLPVDTINRIYGMETFEGWQFFSTEESFNEAYERDWCDYEWIELSDELLAEWINRLADEGVLEPKD